MRRTIHDRFNQEIVIMIWNVSQASQQFAEIVRQAADKPQLIYHHQHLVAAVIDVEDYRVFREWFERVAGRSLACQFSELRQIMAEEDYELSPSDRTTRANALVETLEG